MAMSCPSSSITPCPDPTGARMRAVREADAFLEQALSDPIVRLVLRRDGLQPIDVVEVIQRARKVARRGLC